MTFQEIIESIKELSNEDQELLFELIHKRRIEARRAEIAANALETNCAGGRGRNGTVRQL